ncbi:hypothetical protein DFJ77DRAFT_468320 [Powellomyces hirtus]|nr:hypothetical protein DFJ77DRAFT_468320 [Powellomyces hirtus]
MSNMATTAAPVHQPPIHIPAPSIAPKPTQPSAVRPHFMPGNPSAASRPKGTAPRFPYADRFSQDLLKLYGAYYASIAKDLESMHQPQVQVQLQPLAPSPAPTLSSALREPYDRLSTTKLNSSVLSSSTLTSSDVGTPAPATIPAPSPSAHVSDLSKSTTICGPATSNILAAASEFPTSKASVTNTNAIKHLLESAPRQPREQFEKTYGSAALGGLYCDQHHHPNLSANSYSSSKYPFHRGSWPGTYSASGLPAYFSLPLRSITQLSSSIETKSSAPLPFASSPIPAQHSHNGQTIQGTLPHTSTEESSKPLPNMPMCSSAPTMSVAMPPIPLHSPISLLRQHLSSEQQPVATPVSLSAAYHLPREANTISATSQKAPNPLPSQVEPALSESSRRKSSSFLSNGIEEPSGSKIQTQSSLQSLGMSVSVTGGASMARNPLLSPYEAHEDDKDLHNLSVNHADCDAKGTFASSSPPSLSTLLLDRVPLYEGDMYDALFNHKDDTGTTPTSASPYTCIATIRPMVPEARRTPFSKDAFGNLRPWLAPPIAPAAAGESAHVPLSPSPTPSLQPQPRPNRSTNVMQLKNDEEETLDVDTLMDDYDVDNHIAHKRTTFSRDSHCEETDSATTRRQPQPLKATSKKRRRTTSPTDEHPPVSSQARTCHDASAPEQSHQLPHFSATTEYEHRLEAITKAERECRAELDDLELFAERIRKKVYELELQQLDEEEQQIKDGTHSKYLQSLSTLREAREARLSVAANTLHHTIVRIQTECDAAAQLATDTFLDRRSATRTKMANTLNSHAWVIFEEEEEVVGATFAPPILSPLEISASRLNTSLTTAFDTAPAWLKTRLRKRKQDIIDGTIIVPAFPVGLQDWEMEDDLRQIRCDQTRVPSPSASPSPPPRPLSPRFTASTPHPSSSFVTAQTVFTFPEANAIALLLAGVT